jgi:molecular chaperone DnaJ
MAAQTYYQILGVSPKATQNQIKRAFHRLAKKYHPDKNANAVNLYASISQAYEILHNPQTRKTYDQETHNLPQAARQRKGNDIKITLRISPIDLISEQQKSIRTTRLVPCADCNGTGSPQRELPLCPTCNGSGYDIISSIVGEKKFCKNCRGYGTIHSLKRCCTCNGRGLTEEVIRRTIKLSALDPIEYVIVGSGNYAFGGQIAGDLRIVTELVEDPIFKIKNGNIIGRIDITPAQAVLGDKVYLQIYDKTELIVIPPRVFQGAVLEIKGAGINRKKNCGSLILKVQIIIPSEISVQEQVLYEKLLQIQKGSS